MNIKYSDLENLRKFINSYKNSKIKIISKEIEKDFEIKFTHESTKIEGNTLTIFEVKTILEDGFSVEGKKLKEIFEVINNKKAFDYIKELIENKVEFSEELIKDIHEIITQNIFLGGIYRNVNVRITGASFIPPDFTKVREEMKNFIFDYNLYKKILNPIELSSFVHAEFVRIHPFPDGNGRTARILMNFILMKENFKPISIKAKEKAKYYSFLDFYGKTKLIDNLKDFTNLIMLKEYEKLLEYKLEILKLKEQDINL